MPTLKLPNGATVRTESQRPYVLVATDGDGGGHVVQRSAKVATLVTAWKRDTTDRFIVRVRDGFVLYPQQPSCEAHPRLHNAHLCPCFGQRLR